jgi:hypothetical protein
MTWLGYFMAGIMWHLNKQIYHCKKKYGKKNAHGGSNILYSPFSKYTVIYEMILLQCLIYHITSTIGIIFSINQSMLFQIKTISQNYEHCTEW